MLQGFDWLNKESEEKELQRGTERKRERDTHTQCEVHLVKDEERRKYVILPIVQLFVRMTECKVTPCTEEEAREGEEGDEQTEKANYLSEWQGMQFTVNSSKYLDSSQARLQIYLMPHTWMN